MSLNPLRDVEAPGRIAAVRTTFWTMAALGLALSAAPLRILPPPAPPILYPLAALYFWMVFRTAATPIWTGLVLGLGQDALMGGTWGVGPAGYALATIFIWTAAPALRRERFGALWIGAAIACAAYALGAWAASSIAARRVLDSDVFLIQAAVTVSLYPMFHRLFTALDGAARRMG